MNDDHISGTINEAAGRVKDAVGGLTGDGKMQAEGKVDELKGQAQQMMGEGKDAVDAAAGSASAAASEAAAQASEALRHTAESVRARAGAVGGRVYEAGATAGSYVGHTVQEQPILSLIGMAAIGYLIGYLVHAPSSPLTPEPRYRRIVRRWS